MANLLSNTTVGGSAVITTSNIGSYALTSIPATISPTNIYVGNAIYFNAGNNYLNWSGSRINSNVGIQSAVDMVAPIFYDADNGGYYGNFASTSNLYKLQLGGSSEILGLLGMGSSYWYGMGITNAYTAVYSHFQGNGVQLGSYNGTTFTPRLTVGNDGIVTAESSLRAPVFVDSNDTNYYLDPNGLSVLSHIRLNNNWANAGINQGAINIRGQYPSMQFRNTVSDSMWLRHMDGSGSIQHYYASDGVDSSNWSIKHSMHGNGNFSSVGTHTASQFNGSGAGLTGTASSLSVGYATTAGALSSMNISQFTNNSGYITGYTETDTLASVTGRGATTASQVSFTKTDDHAISVGTIRGRAVGVQGGEFIQLYERVNIGGPSGWGASNTSAPSYGLSVYGGATIGYGNSAGLAVTGRITVQNGNDSGTLYGPNSTWGAYLYVGAATNNVASTTAQVISTDGNLHIDSGSGSKQIYMNYYSGMVTGIYGGLNMQNTYITNASYLTTNTYVRAGTNVYTDQNYGYGLVGLYNASRYQGVFAMGDAYKLSADGTSTGNLYGLAWSHPNAGGQTKGGLEHQLLVMNYGVTQTAIGTGIWTNGLITTTSYGTSANWNTAFGWGNHASVGYLTSLPSHNHDDRYLVKGGGWYGVGLPGSRWGGFSVNGGEIVFGDGLPNAGQMGMLIDGAYLAGENNGFWSLPSDNAWSGRRGMSWNGTYLDFTANSPTAQFTTLRLANGFELQQGGSDYGRFSSWVFLPGAHGLYSSISGAHFYPNTNSYGSWVMEGQRNGWQGIEFRSGSNGAVTLMINADSNTSGFHNNSYGWQFRWNNGTLYCHKNAYGAGTEATVLDSSNYSSWAQPIASAINTGNIGSQSVSYATSAQVLSSTNYIIQRGSNGSWNADFQATPAGSLSYGGDLGANGTNGPGGSWWIQQNFRHTNSSNYWGTQVAWGWEDNANRLATRNITGGSYGAWVYYLNSSNFTSYAPSLTGSGASGTWSINVTGGAGSAGSVPASGITGQTGMWVSSNRPGAYRLYRNDDDSAYNVQTTWSADKASHWSLRGYYNDSYHAPCYVASSGFADNAGQLNNVGYLVGDNWNTYYTSGKLRVASVAGSTSIGAPPNVHNYGGLLSYGISGEDVFQMYFPDNANNVISNNRKLAYRTGRNVNANPTNNGWCDWRTVVDMVGDTLTIVEGSTPKIVVRGSTGYGSPTSASIELVGDADNNQTKSYRWISTAPDWNGQDLRLERYSINGGYQLVGRVPKNTSNLEWQGTIVQGLSDSRVKTNVVSMTEGLDKIDRIRPVTFDWVPTENVSDREGADFGFIAQELEEVLPEVVHTRGDGYKTVMYEKVVPVLVQAMKEQQKMIEALRAEVELLKNK